MRAVVLESFGEPEVLKVADIPEPTPGPDEVIVEVAATALNRADLLAAAGLLSRPEARLWRADVRDPGHGALGPGRRPGRACHGVGDRRRGHGDRERRRLRRALRGARAPAALGARSAFRSLDAAAIPEVFITAWDALVVQGGLTSGRSRARARGRVGRGHRRHPDREGDRSAGARHRVGGQGRGLPRRSAPIAAVDYRSEDFVAAALEFTGGRGVDVVLDVIGGDYLERNLDALATQGTIVQVGADGRAARRVVQPREAAATSGRALIGTVLRARPLEEKVADHPAVRPRDAAALRPGPAQAGHRPALPVRQTSSTRTATWSRTRTSARSCSTST